MGSSVRDPRVPRPSLAGGGPPANAKGREPLGIPAFAECWTRKTRDAQLTVTLRGLADSDFTSVSRRTPSLSSAAIFSASIELSCTSTSS